ncbi:MAG: hypothetical protein K5683_03980 [Prevotella sp.]|nr:hypothetical protein [Prevotella sp.]
MEIKRVTTSEIHWSIEWNESQQANNRLRAEIGDLSKYFATLKVGNATYNWVVDTIGQWRPMKAASFSERVLILEKTEEIRQAVHARLVGKENLANKICQVPNYEEYIFFQNNDQGGLDIIITGWGCHNFKKAGPFIDTWPPAPKLSSTTIAFTFNGERQPNRPFSIVTPMMNKPDTTDEQGIKVFKEYAGTEITIIDGPTQRQFVFTTVDNDQILEFDVTEQPVIPEPVVSAPPQHIIASLTVLDSKGQPIRNLPFTLSQGPVTQDGILNDQGWSTFIKDTFQLNQPIQAVIHTEGPRQIAPAVFTLDINDNDYCLQEKSPKQGSRLLEIIVAILLLGALAALLIFAFKPGIDELTTLINK